MDKVKLNLKEFVETYPEHATITDFVKYNWTSAEYQKPVDSLVGTWERKPNVSALGNAKWYNSTQPADFINTAPEWVSGTASQGSFSIDGITTIDIYNLVNQTWNTATIRFSSSSNRFCSTFLCIGTVGTPQRAGDIKITEDNVNESKTMLIDGIHSLYDLWQIVIPYWFTKQS